MMPRHQKWCQNVKLIILTSWTRVVLQPLYKTTFPRGIHGNPGRVCKNTDMLHIIQILGWPLSLSFNNNWQYTIYYYSDQKAVHCNHIFLNSQLWGQTVDFQIRLLQVYTICYCVCICWTHYSMVKPSCSNFRVIIAHFKCLNFRTFYGISCSNQRNTICMLLHEHPQLSSNHVAKKLSIV